jgi:leucine efflux protein
LAAEALVIEISLHVALFVGAALLCALEPGPNFVHLSLQTMRRSRQHAYSAAIGMHLGAYPYIVGTSIGLAGLLLAMPTLLVLLKWVAGGYLIWLGIQAFRDHRKYEDSPEPGRDAAGEKIGSSFWKGLHLVLGNPRTPLFYATFPLLFVSGDFSISPSLQILVIAIATNVVFLCVDLAFVHALDKMSLRDRLPGAGNLFRWLGGSLLVGFGVKQLLTRS